MKRYSKVAKSRAITTKKQTQVETLDQTVQSNMIVDHQSPLNAPTKSLMQQFNAEDAPIVEQQPSAYRPQVQPQPTEAPMPTAAAVEQPIKYVEPAVTEEATSHGMPMWIWWALGAVALGGIAWAVTKSDDDDEEIVASLATTSLTVTNTDNDLMPEATGTTEANSTVTVTWSDGSTSTTIANASGVYNVEATKAQANGNISVTATNGTQTSTAVSKTYTSTYLKSTSVTATDADTDNQPTASGTTGANSTVTVTWPDGTTATTIANSSGAYSIESAKVQTNGTITAVAKDATGNTSAAVTAAFKAKDLSGVTAFSLKNYDDLGTSTSDNITHDDSFSLVGTNTTGATVSYQTSTNGTTWTATTAKQIDLVDGTYQFRAISTDASGNTSISSVQKITVDQTDPNVIVFNNYLGSSGISIQSDSAGNVAFPMPTTVTSKDGSTLTRFSSIELTDDKGVTVNVYKDISNTNFTIAPGFSQNYIFNTEDAAGNLSTGTSNVNLASGTKISTDKTAPVAGHLTINGQQATSYTSADGNFDLDILGEETDTYTGLQRSTNNGTTWTSQTYSDFSSNDLADGTYAYRGLTVDNAGNIAYTSTLNVTVDSTIL